MNTVAVLGAAGTIGPAIVADLARSPAVERVLLLDLDLAAVQAVAADHGGAKAETGNVDARRSEDLAGALQAGETAVLVNAASYRLNLSVMEAALAAGCHYLDLGGLYHLTRRQLELGPRFAAAGLTAILGMGSSPGKTNLMAALAAARLDRVDALHVSAAATDPTPPADGRLVTPYALETLLDELTMPAVVLRGGDAKEVAALTDGGEIDFPEPVGRRRAVYTLHSELATFPMSFPGLGEASFRLSLAPVVADRLELLAECGLADTEPLEIRGVPVVPRAVLLACLARRGATTPPSNRTTAVHVVEAEGKRDGRPAAVRVESVTTPHEVWGMGGGVVSTAAPAAEAARRLLAGAEVPAGVVAPEQAFEAEGFLAALADAGCRVTVHDR
ncbi:MAG: saccharopine dehydrogenase family protein [Acidimicrobiia bacterium]